MTGKVKLYRIPEMVTIQGNLKTSKSLTGNARTVIFSEANIRNEITGSLAVGYWPASYKQLKWASFQWANGTNFYTLDNIVWSNGTYSLTLFNIGSTTTITSIRLFTIWL